MFRASQTIALSFPYLLLAAIASTSSVSANEIQKRVDSPSSSSASVKVDDVINVSGNGLESPLPPSVQDTGVAPVSQLSDPTVSLPSQNSQLAALTSVSQFSDVRPTDWAFTALQSLVERYGVIAGYPNSSLFRGDKPITRFEFAAALNAALDKVNEITAAGLADKINKDDLATLQKLQDQFASELANLRGRVDSLEAKTDILQNQQFSTTTKLTGSANFLLGALSSSSNRTDGTNRTTNVLYSYSVVLNLNTSFSGKDLLSLSLGASNAPSVASFIGGKSSNSSAAFVAANSNLANFSADSSTSTTATGSLSVARLYYRFPVGDQATIWLSAYGLQPFDFFPYLSPLRSGPSAPVTAYGLFNPVIFRPGFTDIGIGAAYRFSDQLQLHAAYFGAAGQANKTSSTPAANNALSNLSAGSSANFGLFGGNSTIATQLTFKPSDRFGLSLNFIHKYWSGLLNDADNAGLVSFSGPTGTGLASAPFGVTTPTVADSFGGQFDWRIFDKVGFGGWFSTTAATNLTNGATSNILNAALSLGFFDLFKEGNHAGILVGIPPFVNSTNGGQKDLNTPWIIETFYTHRFDKYISLTPDIYVILNPDQGTPLPIWGFTLRTTFLF